MSAELSKEGSSSQRKYTCDVHARRRMKQMCAHGACFGRPFFCGKCLEERMNDKRPRCRHGCVERHCATCLRQCEHGNGRDTCRQCKGNQCVHNVYKKLCNWCNHWTCHVDGCSYRGHRFCSKASLKHHTTRICPSTVLVLVDGQWTRSGRNSSSSSSQHSPESAELPVPAPQTDANQA